MQALTSLHQVSGSPNILGKVNLCASADVRCINGSELTLEGQILAEVYFHGLLGAFRATFRVVHDGLLANRKPNHRWVLRPVFDVCRNTILLFQDLLEDVIGCTRAHSDSCATALDSDPSYKVTNSEMMSIVWVGGEEIEAAVMSEESGLQEVMSILTGCQSSQTLPSRVQIWAGMRSLAHFAISH